MSEANDSSVPLSDRIAVSLQYEGDGAPVVTSKGSGYIAQQILDIAKEQNIPIKQDPQLIELLSQVELNQEIPQVLYEAVAQVLVFAYQLNDKPFPKK